MSRSPRPAPGMPRSRTRCGPPIREGRLAAGTRLPSTRALAGDLGLSRGTVVEAYAQLAAEGYLDARHGAGTWVADRVWRSAARAPSAAARAARAPRFSFSPGIPDLTSFPQAAWMSALRQGLRGLPAAGLGYGDPRGRSDLREQLASYLSRARGVRADPELVIVCGGFRHGLSLVARALRGAARAGSPSRIHACRSTARSPSRPGLALVPLPVDARGARTDLLDAAAGEAAVLSPAHQFPTGVVLHPDRRAAAIAWATATGGLILEDDYDGELRYDRQPVGALQALAPDRVVYGGTASKTLAPGLRLGWLVVPPRLLEPIVSLRACEDVHVPALEQVALCRLLRLRRLRAPRAQDARALPRSPRPSARHARGMRARAHAGGDLSRARRAARAARWRGDVGGADRGGGAPVARALPAGSALCRGRAPRDGIVIGYGALPEHDVPAGLAALGDLLAACVRQPRRASSIGCGRNHDPGGRTHT